MCYVLGRVKVVLYMDIEVVQRTKAKHNDNPPKSCAKLFCWLLFFSPISESERQRRILFKERGLSMYN